jgi:adenylate cyclase
VRKAGDRLRITAQLVDVASEGHLWSQDYDRTLDDVFAIQSDVAEHVAQALQITLKPAEKTQLAKAGTDDLEAYNAYLQGLYHYNTWSKEGLEKSIEYFKQGSRVIPTSPRLTPPWLFLTVCWPILVIYRRTKPFLK